MKVAREATEIGDQELLTVGEPRPQAIELISLVLRLAGVRWDDGIYKIDELRARARTAGILRPDSLNRLDYGQVVRGGR